MTKTEHLSVYDLVLTARGPVFVGSGKTCAKTDYLFDPEAGTVRMIDTQALFAWLIRNDLTDRYERFILSGGTDFARFLDDCGAGEEERSALCLYSVDAADALDGSLSLKELHTFMRDSRQRAYIPGGSVKGALRTAILADRMLGEKRGRWPDNKLKKNEQAKQMRTLEGEYLNTLPLKNKYGKIDNDPVNSILRGVSISDSEPIPDGDLILVGKYDADETGAVHKLNLCRECVRPGTKLRFKLTLPLPFLVELCRHRIYACAYLFKLVAAFFLNGGAFGLLGYSADAFADVVDI